MQAAFVSFSFLFFSSRLTSVLLNSLALPPGYAAWNVAGMLLECCRYVVGMFAEYACLMSVMLS